MKIKSIFSLLLLCSLTGCLPGSIGSTCVYAEDCLEGVCEIEDGASEGECVADEEEHSDEDHSDE